jgi:hypothetical protein
MKCKCCGNPIVPDVKYCPVCGEPNDGYFDDEKEKEKVEAIHQYHQQFRNSEASNGYQPYDYLSGGIKFLCFLLPIVGIVLYFAYHHDRPQSASSAFKWAFIGIVLNIIGWMMLL